MSFPYILPSAAFVTMVPDMFSNHFDPQGDAVFLPPEAVDWAIRIGHSLPEGIDPWPIYLRSLALKGVQTWLEAGDGRLTPRIIHQHPPDITSGLRVNGFRIGVAVQGSLTTPTVALPRVALRGPDAMHLWIWVEVQEELETVHIRGGLRADQLNAVLPSTRPGQGNGLESGLENGRETGRETRLENETDTVTVPLSAFTVSPDRILLYLHHLDPEHLRTPAQAPAPVEEEPASGRLPLVPGAARASGPTPWSQRVLNVGAWLNNQLDAVAEQWAWTLLAPLTSATALRSPAQELEVILSEVEPLGLAVPPRARAGYTEQAIAGIPLRIYALTWSLVDDAGPEWSLTLFVGPIPNETLPPGLELCIRDSDGVLAHQRFTADTAATYLYGQVFGRWDETFWVELSLPGSPALTLTPFGFDPHPDA
jgi:hypothetical protein